MAVGWSPQKKLVRSNAFYVLFFEFGPWLIPFLSPFPLFCFSIQSVGLVLYSVGYTPTQREAEEFGNSVADENGNVSYDSFMRIFSHTRVDDEQTARYMLTEAFRVYDKDENGLIPANDIRSILSTIGEVIPYDEIDQLLQLVPINDKGRFKSTDFIEMLMTKWK